MALFFYKEKNKDIRAAAYLRLSIEDGDKAESNSIGNQRELIRDFAAERPGLHLVEEYADDGYTGTNFERPGFKRMMEDQENSGCGRIRLDQSSQYARGNHSAKAVRYGAGSFEAGHLRIERPADCKSIFGHRSLRRLWTEHGAAYRIKKRKEIYLSALRHKPQRSGLFLASYQRK